MPSLEHLFLFALFSCISGAVLYTCMKSSSDSKDPDMRIVYIVATLNGALLAHHAIN